MNMNEEELENELRRELNTMERDDLIDMCMTYMSAIEKRSFVEEWQKQE